MSGVRLNYQPALQRIETGDLEKVMRILDACGPETAVPEIRRLHKDLIANLSTFGSCAVATALFIACMNKAGGHWIPMLVEDPEFPEDHVLRTHWVAKNAADPEAPAIDVTVADQEKDMLALGSEAEKHAVAEQLAEPDFLERLQAGLAGLVDEKGRPLLPNTTAEDLRDIYVGLLEQSVRPSNRIHVLPLAVLSVK